MVLLLLVDLPSRRCSVAVRCLDIVLRKQSGEISRAVDDVHLLRQRRRGPRHDSARQYKPTHAFRIAS
jgi:hypothetical protein